MNPHRSRRLMAAAMALAMIAAPGLARAATPNAAASVVPSDLGAALHGLERTWSHIAYQIHDPAAQARQMATLATEAAAVAARNPGRAEPLVWQALALCSQAGYAGGLDALGLARQARTLLEQAGELDYRALGGAIPTTLGSLYDRVPGFPLSFGNDRKARQYLEQGVAISPDGLDANYFYGDFLFRQGDYRRAAAALTHALAAAPSADRPVWDAGRRAEAKALLKQVEAKLAPGG